MTGIFGCLDERSLQIERLESDIIVLQKKIAELEDRLQFVADHYREIDLYTGRKVYDRITRLQRRVKELERK